MKKNIIELADDIPLRYEQIFHSHNKSSGGLSTLMGAAVNSARPRINVRSEHEEVLRDIALNVIAPMQVSYVLWILRRVEELKINRLYFLSRDGQLLFRIARQLIKAFKVDCDLRYFLGSRQTLNRVTGYKSYGSWLWLNVTEQTTIQNLLNRIGMNPVQIKNELEGADFKEDSWYQPIGDKQFKLKKLIQTESIRSLIKSNSEQQKEILLRYLKQEKLDQDLNIGCVDIGWKGSCHASLSTLLRDYFDKSIHGFHFGLTKGYNTWDSVREGYFFDLAKKTGYRNLTPMGWRSGDRMFVLLETFCSADHGTVYDLMDKGEFIEPLLRDGWAQTITDWGYPVIKNSIDVFTEYITERLDTVDISADMRAPVAEILTKFWCDPIESEARVWGSFPLEVGQGQESHLSSMAKPYKWNYPLKLILPNIANPIMNHHWRDGSLRLSSRYMRILMQILFSLHDRNKFKKRHD